MRIFGLDPGMTRMGFAVVDIEDDRSIELCHFGFFHFPRSSGASFNQHLNDAIAGLTDNFPRLLHLYEPDLIYSELVPTGRLGSNSELVVAAVTAVKTISWQFGIQWKDIAANTVKKEVVGNGKATKAAIKKVVMLTYPAVEKKHQEVKKDQRKAAEKASGLPMDVFDGIAIAMAGAMAEGGTLQRGVGDNFDPVRAENTSS